MWNWLAGLKVATINECRSVIKIYNTAVVMTLNPAKVHPWD